MGFIYAFSRQVYTRMHTYVVASLLRYTRQGKLSILSLYSVVISPLKAPSTGYRNGRASRRSGYPSIIGVIYDGLRPSYSLFSPAGLGGDSERG